MSGTGTPRSRAVLPKLLCGLLLALFVFQLGLHGWRAGATTDEPLHLLAGHRHLACGDFAFNPEHPPLLKQLAALPLQAMPVAMPEDLPCDRGYVAKAEAFRLGAGFLQRNGHDRLLVPARAMASLLAVLLALSVWTVAWRMFGPWPAVATMALFATEPVLVAHGSLVTTDMAITATSFLATAVLYASRTWSAWRRVSALGIAFGLMLASKHSALLVLPLLVLLRLLDVGIFRTTSWRAGPHLLRPLAELCAAGAIALAVLWAFYGFRYPATPGIAETVELAGFIERVGKPGADTLALARLLPWIGATGLFPEAYLMGLTDIVGTSVRYTRVLGQVYPQGQWFFYPVALSVKSSMGLLLLLPVGLAMLCRRASHRRELLFLLLPSLGYLAIAMSSKFSDGVRHVLQFYPYALLLAGFGLASLWRRGPGWRLALAALLAWQGIAVARAAPDYIPFANAFWGGPTGAYNALTFDSVEWGQSLKRIRHDAASTGVSRCWIAGVDDPMLFADLAPCQRLPEGRLWRGRRGGVDAVPVRIEGTIYLGARALASREGATFAPVLANPGRVLAGAVRVVEGPVEAPGIAALALAMAADQALREGDIQAALARSRASLALSPADPRGWISRGDALLRAGRRAEALKAAQLAGRLVEAQPEHAFFSAGRLAELSANLRQRQ